MHTVFKTVWEECHQNRHREHLVLAKNEIGQLSPQLSNLEQAERFHLSFLQLFKESAINPINKKVLKTEPEGKVLPQENSSLDPNPLLNQNQQIQQNQINPGMFPYFPFSTPNPNAFPKVEAQEGMSYIMGDKEQPQHLFDVPRFAMQPHPQFFGQPPFFQPKGSFP